MMHTNKRKKTGKAKLSALTVTMAVIGGVVYCVTPDASTAGSENLAKAEAAENDKLADALDDVLQDASGEQDTTDASKETKDETVYVVADAEGESDEIIVSDWLKNLKKGKVKDRSNLTDIENVKGNEKFTQNGEKLTWNSDGSDIYYQGKTESSTPVKIKLTYYLDGKEISPEDLAGKSGKVKIRMDYTNNETRTVTENGKTYRVSVPFTVISGMVLDNDRFSNVKVTNGKNVSTGKNNIVVGYAFPGLEDSLNINEKDLDTDINIPDHVTVEADVKDFKLGMTMSYITPNAMEDLDFDKTLDLSALDDSVDALADASSQLADGANTLYNGTKTVQTGSASLASGANRLESGAGTLKTGAKSLANGTNSLANGTGSLVSGAKQFQTGTRSLSAGTDKLKSGSESLQSGIKEYTEGVSQLQQGVSQLTDTLENGATDEQKSQAVSSVDQEFDNGQYDAIKSQASSKYQAALTSSSELKEALTEQLYAAMVKGQDTALKDAEKSALRSSAETYADTIIQTIASATADSVGESVASAAKSAAETTASETLDSTLKQVASQISSSGLTEGLDKLTANNKSLNQGASDLTSGISSLDSGAQKLYLNTSTLLKGAKQLDAGASQVNSGASKLSGGASTLASGTTTLSNGADQLASGTEELSSGAKTLSDSLTKLDKEGVQKLVDAYHGDVQDLVNRIDAVLDAGDDYTTFTKRSSHMDGNVKFIVRTDEVSADSDD